MSNQHLPIVKDCAPIIQSDLELLIPFVCKEIQLNSGFLRKIIVDKPVFVDIYIHQPGTFFNNDETISIRMKELYHNNVVYLNIEIVDMCEAEFLDLFFIIDQDQSQKQIRI